MNRICPFCFWSVEPLVDPHDAYPLPREQAINDQGAHEDCAKRLGPLAGRGHILLPTFGFQILPGTKSDIALARAFAGVAVAAPGTRYTFAINITDPVKWAMVKLGKRAAKRLAQEERRAVTEWKVWRVVG